METSRETTVAWKTTIIVNASLQNHDAVRMLSGRLHRIRLSHSVDSGAFIFPLSGKPAASHAVSTSTVMDHVLRDISPVKAVISPSENTSKPLGVAFMLVDPQDIPGSFEESGLIERIETFLQVHRNSFLLLFAPFNGKRELQILSAIQHRFFTSNLRVLPVRSNADIVNGMLTIAKATCKPNADSILERISLARANINENSPVWEMLREVL